MARIAGTPNKASRSLREALVALKFNLADEFMELYKSGELDASGRLRLLSTLLEYTHPKLKEQEVPQEMPFNPAEDVPTEVLLKAVGNG